MNDRLIKRTRRPLPQNTTLLGDFDHMLAGFFRPVGDPSTLGRSGWTPAVDVRETNEAYLVEAELPGLGKNDVTVTFEDDLLTFSGERKVGEETEEENYRRIERSYGPFSRSFNLPREVDAEGVLANFKDGLLSITVPKKEQVKPRAIKIN